MASNATKVVAASATQIPTTEYLATRLLALAQAAWEFHQDDIDAPKKAALQAAVEACTDADFTP